MKYKAILFDLDGTLLDTTEGVIHAVKRTISELKLEKLPELTLLEFVGPPMQLSFEKFYGFNKDDALKAANLFRKIYKEESLFRSKLYPNVIETLESLKKTGYFIAVATNKSEENAISLLKHFGIDLYCDFIAGSDLQGKLKKADIIRKCIDELGVDISSCIYVGDSEFDLEGAKKNDIDFVGVSYGFGFSKGEEIGYPIVDEIDKILHYV